MAIIRVKHSDFETKYRVPDCSDTLNTQEWAGGDANRVNEPGWGTRYQYEADLLAYCMKETSPKTVLEIGPGPGVLSEMLQERLGYEIAYHLVDKPYAKTAFEAAKRKGKFFIKDIADGLDPTDLLSDYDFVICNDTLEHLFNPSRVVQAVYNLLATKGIFFVSVPNWRMGHQFVYRGLFDVDNFLFFMRCHKFTPNDFFGSPLKTPDYPLLDSEQYFEEIGKEHTEDMKRSWNWYFTFGKEPN